MEGPEGETVTASPTDDGAQPEHYYHRLVGPEPTPEFHDEVERYWGRRWGAADEVSPLRTVLVRRPSRGLAAITADAWDPRAGALVDPGRRWYWRSDTAPDLDLVDEQHAGLLDALRAEGVEVIEAPDLPDSYTKAVFTRDPLVTVPGGAVITRLAPRMRRGEEASVTATVAGLGMPILGTVTGHGLAEGGTFVKLRRDLAVYGLSIRCNREGARQLAGFLEPLGIDLVTLPLPGYTIHTDGQFHMIADDLALANTHRLPYEFLDRLEAMGITVVSPHPDEQYACNSLTVRPRRLLFPAHCVRTADRLAAEGVEIVPVPYDEVLKNGGGIHCSTMELVRDW
ncbi:MAG: amidinotransferase [Streptosporangiales bacterium]|nr:amidinotransferase [Streptosporangiales bacterium]